MIVSKLNINCVHVSLTLTTAFLSVCSSAQPLPGQEGLRGPCEQGGQRGWGPCSFPSDFRCWMHRLHYVQQQVIHKIRDQLHMFTDGVVKLDPKDFGSRKGNVRETQGTGTWNPTSSSNQGLLMTLCLWLSVGGSVRAADLRLPLRPWGPGRDWPVIQEGHLVPTDPDLPWLPPAQAERHSWNPDEEGRGQCLSVHLRRRAAPPHTHMYQIHIYMYTLVLSND